MISLNKFSRNLTYGFTLIEVLITIVIVGILGTMATQSLLTLLRNQSKTDIIKEIKQNGDYALSQMEVKIRNAKTAGILGLTPNCNSTGATGNNLTIINPDNSVTNFICLTNRLQQQDIPAGTTGPSPSPNFLSNTLVSVTTTSCANIFTCTVPSNNVPRKIRINFTLQESAVNAIAAEKSSQTFATEVSLRNK